MRARAAPDWTGGNESDPGITIVELFEYLADVLSYYQDQVATEARLRTRRRVAIGLALATLAVLRCGRKRAQVK